MKKVLIFGQTGNIGTVLTDYLLKNTDNEVYGLIRRKSNISYDRIQKFENNPRFKLIYGDVSDDASVSNVVRDTKPDYLFNLSGYTLVGSSFECPELVYNVNVLGLMRVLEAVKKFNPECRVFQAGSSEQFANTSDFPQTIETKSAPRNPYGGSKIAAHDLIKIYRDKYSLYAVNGILYTNASSYSSEELITKKITKNLALIKRGIKKDSIKCGYLEALRCFTSTFDVVDSIWKMLNQDTLNVKFSTPKDYIICSNELHAVKEFFEYACFFAGIPFEWRGDGFNEFAFNPDTGNKILEVSAQFYHPETQKLFGDSSPIKNELGWNPKVGFRDIIKEMVDFDLKNTARI